MIIPVVWLSFKDNVPARGYWDHGMLEDIFASKMWQPYPAPNYKHYDDPRLIDLWSLSGKGAIVVFPARSQVDKLEELNIFLGKLKWVVLMLTGDEEASFPVESIDHPNIRIWVMSPREKHHAKYHRLGSGYPPQARENLAKASMPAYDRKQDYYFAGQITHQRRQEFREQMESIQENTDLHGEFIQTEGFTQGKRPAVYYNGLASSKITPAPSGPETPDTFRLFEALEAGCIPIADALTPKGNSTENYWTWFFGEEPPFPRLTNFTQLTGYMMEARENWLPLSNRIYAWWQQYKRHLVMAILNDVYELSDNDPQPSAKDTGITVIITSSPIPDHPSTKILEETIETIRTHLPDAEILIGFDGVRPEQEDRREAYQQYIHDALWLCNFKWHNVVPYVSEEHLHQANLTRSLLDFVCTPVVLFVEHDTPITPDRAIEWRKLTTMITTGDANIIRLHHEEIIHPEHQHMMMHYQPGLAATMQWSQRPHLASTAFYRWMIGNYFHPESKTMIEDVMHGIVQEQVQNEGLAGWYLWRLFLYVPDTDELGIKRSYHLDGRGGDPKYDTLIKEPDHAK